jgi:hypothetical protein
MACGQNISAQALQTIQYYRDLFRDAFKKGNFMIVFTRIPLDEYNRRRKAGLDEWVSSRGAEVVEELKLECTVTGEAVVINSVPPAPWVRTFDANPDKPIPPASDAMGGVYVHSWEQRARILNNAARSAPVDMLREGVVFPLPPTLEKLRKAMLGGIRQQIQMLVDTVKRSDKLIGDQIENERRLLTKIADCKKELRGARCFC